MRNAASNPWKILAGMALAFALLFALLVSSGIYWFASNHKARGPGVPVAQPRRVHLARAVDPDPGPGSESERPKTISKNAILASKEHDSKVPPGSDLFNDELIPSLKINIPRQGMSSLGRSPRKYVTATIEEGTMVYTNVGIHLKGGPGSYRSLNDIPSFTLNFDKFAPGQTFHGLKKIHLNSSVQDGSRMEEKISRELFEAAGVPVPRAGNAIVNFDGREMGMYVLVEGVNKQFLKRYFSDAKGNVYDGHSQTDVTDNLPTNDGENPKDKSRLRALAAAAQSDLDTRLVNLEKTLDLDRFLSFVAMEMIVWHWDGYCMNRNNYRIFHDRETDRMVFIPHGMDQMFSNARGSVFRPPSGLVARSALEIPEVRRRYRERVAQLTTNVFKADLIAERIREVAGKIEAEMDDSSAQSHRQRANSFIRKIQQRAAYLQAQVAPAPPVEMNELGIALLNDWQTRRDLGDALLSREEDNNGSPVLHISTKEGCTASWRTTKALNPGRYRFEAKIKTRGVVLNQGDPRAGAGLRISRYRVGQKNDGDKDWMPVNFDFEVPEEQNDVELVCELRADRGDVWFDLKSLRLKRL